jgi:hypothetical protein
MASGALAARVADAQIILLPVSLAALGSAHYFAYRHGQRGAGQRAVLWTVTVISVGFWIAPLVVR